MSDEQITQEELVKEFFINNPGREVKHPEVVDWLVSEYRRRTSRVFRDPDRAIRKLSQEGFLIKIAKGVYKYDPASVVNRELEDFTEWQKEEIKRRDGYKCVICGRGERDGVELHIDHIKPKELGGKASVENGQTLCAQHNFMKKTLQQTETGKKMFIRLYELAKAEGEQQLMDFCVAILEVFEGYHINDHIEWER